MQSKYWVVGPSDMQVLRLDNAQYQVSLFPDGGCGVCTNHHAYDDPNVIDVLDMVQFIAMMQEAHELARQHFGEQWGEQE